MKKIAVTDECPIVYENFWSTKVLDKLNKKIDRFCDNHTAPTPAALTQFVWPERIVQDSGPILLLDLTDEEIVADIRKELNVIYDTSHLKTFYCGIHIFLKGAYIPWHADEGYNFGVATYLNQEPWNWNWGGALLCENEHGEIQATFPEYNKMIIQSCVQSVRSGDFGEKNNINHATSILSQSAPPRISLQIFGSTEEDQRGKPKNN